MSDWTTLGELPPGTLFETEGGERGLKVRPTVGALLQWVRVGDGVHMYDGRTRRVRPLRKPSSVVLAGIVADLEDGPDDAASLCALRDWLTERQRVGASEGLTARLGEGWRGLVMEAVEDYGEHCQSPWSAKWAKIVVAHLAIRRLLGLEDA